MVALYVHWPFCRSKCPYCDFNSHVRPTVDQDRWRRALVRETQTALAAYRADHPDARVESVFFGGGTPSLMPPETAAAVLETAGAILPFEDGCEVTLEANPTSVEAERFQGFRAAGIGRVSLGVQSLNDEALRFLGREHGAREARAAVELAAETFPRHSFDLIYARPDQTAADWAAELDAALALAGDHLSLYQLTLEPGTAFHTRARLGERMAADPETSEALWEATQDRTTAAGFEAYEVSNHARPGGECRHNLVYWRYQDFVGVGPGAHGRIGRPGPDGGEKWATTRLRLPEKWLAAVEADGAGLAETSAIDPADRRRELMLMGLRLSEGVPEARLVRETGAGLAALDAERLADLEAEGYLRRDSDADADAGPRLRATDAGRARLDALLAYLLD